MGNRGCIHGKPREIVRPWQVRRWITCALEYKGWVAPRWEPRRWTPLFFWDEAVALAAGHRPCALCRHAAYLAWLDAWEEAFGDRPKADPMDRRLHDDRVDGRAQRRHRLAWDTVPDGAFVLVAGDGGDHVEGVDVGGGGGGHVGGVDDVGGGQGGAQAGDGGQPGGDGPRAAVVLGDRLVPWSAAGYGPSIDRPARGDATVLTPRATVEVIRHGYRPLLHPSATDRC